MVTSSALMDNYTDQTKPFLEDRFGEDVDGIYFSHQPIYGYRSKYSAASNISRYMITKSILNALYKFSFSNFIDIGGAEGYTAFLVRHFFQVSVTNTDLSENACKMAQDIFNITSLPCDIHHLPFADRQYDVVLCSETIEHVTDFKAAIAELLRICSKVLIITVPHESIKQVQANLRDRVPHGHIHYFDTSTLDYIKSQGYSLEAHRTLSPFLIIPRVIAEGSRKHKTGFIYSLYNGVTPFLKYLFGIRTAIFLVNVDVWFCRLFKLYQGITFVIVKDPSALKNKIGKSLGAGDFIKLKVPLHSLENKGI